MDANSITQLSNLAMALRLRVLSAPDQPVLCDYSPKNKDRPDIWYTATELDVRARGIAAWLQERG